MPVTIEAHQLSIRYKIRRILHGIDFTAESGEFIVVAGPAASGKTALLAAIAGEHTEIAGTLIVNGHNRASSTRQRHSLVGVTYLRQRPYLISDRTVAANIESAVRRRTTASATVHRRTHEMIASLRLDDVRDMLPHELCSSHHQTTCVAVALAERAPVILLDQPVAILTQQLADTVLAATADTARSGSTIMVASPDYRIQGYSDRVIDLGPFTEAGTV